MSAMRTPLWQQLLGIWFGAILLSGLLIWLDLQRAERFIWLFPYPSWRHVGSIVGNLFRLRPVLATALFGVPAIALLASLGLFVARLMGTGAGELPNRAV